MYVIRKDGIGVRLAEPEHTTKKEALDFAHKNQYLAVLFEGSFIFAGANPFTKQLGRLRVLETIPDNAKLFTDTDVAIKDVLFYFEGIFGMNSKNELYTRLYAPEFTVLAGNTFRFYLRDGIIVILTVYSPDHLSLDEVLNDTRFLAREIHGFGKRVDFVLTPKSTGYFDLG